ncbi:hypothetical protein [Pelagovum pacificum]|uniref:Uncharacterized protein n=1 Tax=Pelagovum pacificum TaxID=2588711 RepID=A0A5C5GGY2_9RHOB|nr:hypothetical protein [Pelagovum pacificum]QQA43664.1 hypothetical protein I8N54_03555 [Pelagovum pacificum]TNY33201.1 hypothetical protein FHY64_07975 [Pelagovum pacificum]
MPRFHLTLVALAMLPLAAAADTATYKFKWAGSDGYRMDGVMSFDATLLSTRERITHDDLDCFAISGTHEGAPIGTWGLAELLPETTWYLEFDVASESFTLPNSETAVTQGWNMNGTGNDCGVDGFGFNLGNYAQDICVDNELVVASQVDPTAPFPAVRDDGLALPANACPGAVLMMKSGR